MNGSSVGLLRRRTVGTAFLVHLGKEANRLEKVEAGLEHDPDEVYTEYTDPRRDRRRTLVLPSLRRMPSRELAATVGMSERRLRDVFGNRSRPHQRTEAALTRIAVDFARSHLDTRGFEAPADDLATFAAWLLARSDNGG